MKTQIYNLIILDESGSMQSVTSQTVSGCRETIGTILSVQKKYSDTQEHFISIFSFQSGEVPSRYLVKNLPAAAGNFSEEKVAELLKQYSPCGCTPLYDAIGSTLTDLKALASDKEDAVGSVTIITDGLENSSEYYSHDKVARMIEQQKEMGWNFNFIGANIDVVKVSLSLKIDNCLAFVEDEKGTEEMFEKERTSRSAYYDRMNCAQTLAEPYVGETASANQARRRKLYKDASGEYFAEGNADGKKKDRK